MLPYVCVNYFMKVAVLAKYDFARTATYMKSFTQTYGIKTQRYPKTRTIHTRATRYSSLGGTAAAAAAQGRPGTRWPQPRFTVCLLSVALALCLCCPCDSCVRPRSHLPHPFYDRSLFSCAHLRPVLLASSCSLVLLPFARPLLFSCAHLR